MPTSVTNPPTIPDHTNSTHSTEITLYEHLTREFTGTRSELWSLGYIESGDIIEPEDKTPQAGGNLGLTEAQSHTSNLYSNILDSCSYMHLPIVILELHQGSCTMPFHQSHHNEFVC